MDIRPRRTKIVATLGPASDDPLVFEQMIKAGLDVVRLNLSHSTHEEHAARIKMVQAISEKMGKPIGLLADLQGPKLRIGCFKEKKVVLKSGQTFYIDPKYPDAQGTSERVGTSVQSLATDVFPGDILLLDDGKLTMKVIACEQAAVRLEVITGGTLSDHKGLNRKGGGLSADSLTEKDYRDIKFLSAFDLDYVAMSFVKKPSDIQLLKEAFKEQGVDNIQVVAKIETSEAVANLEAIIEEAEAVMVARGDLGVEIGYAELPGVQKNIIHLARTNDKVVITATQMMESMTTNPIPTRAEVSDVANAALDGTDAVMLSQESAVGLYPVETVQAMSDICIAAERQKRSKLSRHRMNVQFERVDETIAMASMYIANHMDLTAIIALTESGSTPLWMSRIRSSVPIFGFSRHSRTCGRMTLYRGVHPVHYDLLPIQPEAIAPVVITYLLDRGHIQKGDRVLLTKGDKMGENGAANSLIILTA